MENHLKKNYNWISTLLKSAPNNFLMPEAGLKKRWRFNVINGIIKANNENKLRMPILSKTNKLLNIRC